MYCLVFVGINEMICSFIQWIPKTPNSINIVYTKMSEVNFFEFFC